MKNKIKELRIRDGLTLEYLSFRSNVSVSYLSLLEHGKRKKPSISVMDKIAHALEKPVSDVFFD